MIAPPALQSWQVQQAQDDPAELSRLRLAGIATQDRIADEIDRAVAAGDLPLAESFVALAAERGTAVAPDRIARIEALKANALARAVSDFGYGFVAGERESDAAFAGALVGDISGFGDLRDLAREGRKYIDGERTVPGRLRH